MLSNACQILALLLVKHIARLQVDNVVGVRRAYGRVDEPIVDEIADDLEQLAVRRARELRPQAGS